MVFINHHSKEIFKDIGCDKIHNQKTPKEKHALKMHHLDYKKDCNAVKGRYTYPANSSKINIHRKLQIVYSVLLIMTDI